MGYDVHITRASEWSQNEGQEITREEWLAQVQSDPELALDLQNGPCFAVWSRPSQNPDAWIDWFNGDLFTKNPDRALVGKMLQIATRLGAKVQGDDGEEYRSTADWPAADGSGPGVAENENEAYEASDRLPTAPKRSFGELVTSWFHRRPSVLPPPVQALPFGVGSRVKDTGGAKATVVAIDPSDMHGFGSITVLFDNGTQLTYALFAHGFELADD